MEEPSLTAVALLVEIVQKFSSKQMKMRKTHFIHFNEKELARLVNSAGAASNPPNYIA
jgi:hypothetical protein